MLFPERWSLYYLVLLSNVTIADEGWTMWFFIVFWRRMWMAYGSIDLLVCVDRGMDHPNFIYSALFLLSQLGPGSGCASIGKLTLYRVLCCGDAVWWIKRGVFD